MALEEDRSIPVVELGLIQEVEKNLSKWFPKEYSLTRKRKVCVCSLFPHLKGYDETQVRFRTKVKGVLVDVIPLLVPVGTDTMSKDSSFRQKLKVRLFFVFFFESRHSFFFFLLLLLFRFLPIP